MSRIRHITWLIYLLAVCLVCLSTKARLAPYDGDLLVKTPQITQATKMAEGRHSEAFVVAVRAVTPLPCPNHPRFEALVPQPPLRILAPSCWSPAAVRPPPVPVL